MHYRPDTRAMNVAWTNALALAAIAVAIALLVAKNRDRNPPIHLLERSAIFKVSSRPTANP